MVRMIVNDEFEVRLAATPATGYQWEAGPLPDGITHLGTEYAQPSGGAPGDAGEQVFRFRAERSGDFPLQFVLKRPWETTAARTHEVVVTKR